MMKDVYCIKDRRTGFQPELMLFENDHVAKRWLYQLICDYKDSERLRNAPLIMYPDDFELWFVGNFDSTDGFVELGVKPTMVCTVADFIKEK